MPRPRARVVLALYGVLAVSACGGAGVGDAADAGPAAGSGTRDAAEAHGGGGGSGGRRDDGRPPAGDAGADAGATEAPRGPFAVPGLPYAPPEGQALDLAAGKWSFVTFEDAHCANGSETGIAVNPAGDGSPLLLFLQGGGACWDEETCLAQPAAVHLQDVVGETVALGEVAQLSGLFDRTSPLNPFADYSHVYVPYCTGDMHAGTRAATYESAAGPVTLQHVGARNLDAYLARLSRTFTGAPRVVVAGISAGGYGASLNWWRIQAAFPHARVDVLDDSGLLIDAKDDRFEVQVARWGMVLPPGCADCGRKLSALLPFYGQHLTAPRRYGLMAFLHDATISGYFGLSGPEVADRLAALRNGAAANQKTFFLDGALHVVLSPALATATSDGTTGLAWVIAFEGDGAFEHAGP